MRFALLLLYLKIKLKKTVKHNETFRDNIRTKSFTILIKTKNGKHSRFYRFKEGIIESRRGEIEKPDVSIIWCDAATAFNVMTSGVKDENAMEHAIFNGKFRIEGESHYAIIFGYIIEAMFKAAKTGE